MGGGRVTVGDRLKCSRGVPVRRINIKRSLFWASRRGGE